MEEPEILLAETSPYGSLEALLEDDGRTVYLYLRHAEDEEWGMRALWVANRLPAPEREDREAMRQGIAPLMPRSGTRSEAGTPSLPAEELSFVWFEEGDGLALYRRNDLLAVLPPWAGPEMPGYTAEARGEQRFAWELAPEARENLGRRLERAREYWRWRASDNAWREIQGAGLTHLERLLGPHRQYWSADGGQFPPRAVVRCEPESLGGISVYATVGMSAQPLPQVEMHFEEPEQHRRVELVLASREPADRLAGLLSGVMRFPWERITWLGDGHTYTWGKPSPCPGESAVLLLKAPPAATVQTATFRSRMWAPDLSGLADRTGEPVNYLWLVPISGAERELAAARGSSELVERLAREGRGWLWE